MYKYYCLVGINTKDKLGEFYILASRKNRLEDWIANAEIDDGYEIGRRIMEIVHGKFFLQ